MVSLKEEERANSKSNSNSKSISATTTTNSDNSDDSTIMEKHQQQHQQQKPTENENESSTSTTSSTNINNNIFQKTVDTQNHVPSTPCTRICRYNANVFNGQVCIGCFRETYEIATWASLSDMEKYYTLLDAADRVANEEETSLLFLNTIGEEHEQDGSIITRSITQEELLRQADYWKERTKN